MCRFIIFLPPIWKGVFSEIENSCSIYPPHLFWLSPPIQTCFCSSLFVYLCPVVLMVVGGTKKNEQRCGVQSIKWLIPSIHPSGPLWQTSLPQKYFQLLLADLRQNQVRYTISLDLPSVLLLVEHAQVTSKQIPLEDYYFVTLQMSELQIIFNGWARLPYKENKLWLPSAYFCTQPKADHHIGEVWFNTSTTPGLLPRPRGPSTHSLGAATYSQSYQSTVFHQRTVSSDFWGPECMFTVKVWRGKRNHIICKEQRTNSEDPDTEQDNLQSL